jgi:hypothetical protein
MKENSRFAQGFVNILQIVGDSVHHNGHVVIQHLKAQWDTSFRITCDKPTRILSPVFRRAVLPLGK